SSGSSTTFSATRLPTTAASTRRLSGSSATWPHASPRNRSASSAGSQRLPFLATNDHFSSSWSLVVLGGKGHESVVGLLGGPAGQQAVAHARILVHPDQAAGLAGAAAVGEVPQHGHGLLRGQAAVEQRGAPALGEARLARAAAQQPAVVRPVARRR